MGSVWKLPPEIPILLSEAYFKPLVSGADQQPTLDTVGMDEVHLHSRGNCGWISCLSLLACLFLL